MPESADYVMYWWHIAATLAREGKIRRFGLITTNSLRQTFNRRVVQHHMEQKKPLSLVFAIPDRRWAELAVLVAYAVVGATVLPGFVDWLLHYPPSDLTDPGLDSFAHPD